MQPPQTPHSAKFDDNVKGFPDPFAPTRGHAGKALINAIVATAVFRALNIIVFFTLWATFITVLNERREHPIVVATTILTVIGTVIGFIISYRTTSSFERYNEGRRYWSQIILSSRTFARTVWFHVPDQIPGDNSPPDQIKAKVLIEKKSVINLVEAFAVAVKHYLRGEDGVFYADIYDLVKFLPSYGLPQGIPDNQDNQDPNQDSSSDGTQNAAASPTRSTSSQAQRVQFSALSKRTSANAANPTDEPLRLSTLVAPASPSPLSAVPPEDLEKASVVEAALLPARMPEPYSVFDFFPFSLLVRILTHRGKDLKGRKAARLRAILKNRHKVSHNLPLEISLYLSSYIATMQARKVADAPTATVLIAQLNQLVDALTGLERILTTPIPYSYSVHLWTVTVLYCLAMPFQIWETMRWVTIPATGIASLIFFGFLVAGEEIENPFGYDKNDLNMDHYTHNIIRQELRAITASQAPDPSEWAFSPDNNLLFSTPSAPEQRVQPDEWLRRGSSKIRMALASY